MTSANRQILSATIVVAICTLTVKLASAGKDLLVAGVFGVSAALDSFLLAYMFPALCINVLAGSLQAVFIPKYVLTRAERGAGAAASFAASTATMLFVMLAVTALAIGPLSILVLPKIAGRMPAQYIDDVWRMSLIMSPVIVLNGLMYFWSAFLNTNRRYALPALTPLMTPVCVLVSALTLASKHGVSALVLGTLFGGLIELAILLLAARSAGQPRWFAYPTMTSTHRAMFVQFGAVSVGAILLGGTSVIDQIFAASLGEGGVSALTFGTKLSQVTAGIFTMAMATAVLPSASMLVAKRDWDGLRRVLRTYTGVIAALTVPVTVLLVIFSEDVVRVLFERGAFDSRDTEVVSLVQSLSVLQIPLFAWSMLSVRVLSAISANSVLPFGAAMSLCIDAAANFLLVPIYGIAGTAVATPVMYFVAAVFYWFAVHRRIRILEADSARAADPGAEP